MARMYQSQGGANIIQQFIELGFLDPLQIHLASFLIGDGIRLFDGMGTEHIELETTRVVESPRVTHLRFRVLAHDGSTEI
jgi:dihydrofolate reductase